MGIANKKSMVFTLVAIMLVAVLFIYFAVEINHKYKKQMQVVEIRVETINNFIKDVEKDLERGLYITGFRSLLALDNHIVENGRFLEDVSKSFSEAMINGTINNTKSSLLNDSSFKDWTDKIKEEAGKIGIIIDFTEQKVNIYQDEYWSIAVEINLSYTIMDSQGTSSWNRKEHLKTRVPIGDFEDPVYALNSYGKVPNKIIKSSYTDFSSINNLKIHLNNSYYIESGTAPDFLMRLEGNLSNSTFGIESLVNLDKFSQQGLPTYAKSVVDYIYFGNVTISSCVVNETYDDGYTWFRLDNGAEPDNHIDNYEVTCR